MSNLNYDHIHCENKNSINKQEQLINLSHFLNIEKLNLDQMLDEFINSKAFIKLISKFLDKNINDLNKEMRLVFLSAFTHKSFMHEHNLKIFSAQRFEFLGDSILGFVTSEFIFTQVLNGEEGDLSKIRNLLVNENSLATFALLNNFDQIILVGKGEFGKQGFLRKSLLADTMESFISSIFINFGLEQAKKFILEYIGYSLKNQKISLTSIDEGNEKIKSDAKSLLQELTLKKFGVLPEYISKELYQNNDLFFEVAVYLNKKLILKDIFKSKKDGKKILANKIIQNNLINNINTQTIEGKNASN